MFILTLDRRIVDSAVSTANTHRQLDLGLCKDTMVELVVTLWVIHAYGTDEDMNGFELLLVKTLMEHKPNLKESVISKYIKSYMDSLTVAAYVLLRHTPTSDGYVGIFNRCDISLMEMQLSSTIQNRLVTMRYCRNVYMFSLTPWD